ncbi:hypothetical protein [Mycobacterium sp. TY815]|uniref:glycine-rich domain-containing protein n=1 Tax=Mycobacterium sp. TY815 TaxID=3050581 RepID=UPI00274287F7|nr:hypothetical protein [Mycobacterium sp. TY815]MDP7706794.1 hypothetical protein [Mycobacterium sp. TY815]
MTVPGGVPNLPVGGMTIDTLAAKVQDTAAETMRNLASQRFPSIFDGSTGGSVLSDLSPFGIITRIWSEVNSAIANADPADINGPEDIPPLLLDFIESLPVVGELVGLMEAILGTYTGDDAVLLAIQQIFMPIRKLLQLVSGQPVGWPTVEETTSGWVALGDALTAVATDTATFLSATGQATFSLLGAALQTLISWLSAIPANLLSGSVPLPSIPSLPLSQMPSLGGYLTNLNPSGILALTGLGTGSLPVGVTSAINQITGLSGYLTNLTSGGVLNLAGLGTGSLPAGISASISQVTGLTSALAAALTSASPLNSANLTGTIQQAVAPWVAPIDTLMNAWGIPSLGHTAAELSALAASIPNANIAGLLGGADIGTAIQQTVNAGAVALGAVNSGANASLAQWGNALTSAITNYLGYNPGGAAPAGSVAKIASDTNATVNARAVQKTTYANLDKAMDATFDLAEVNGSSTLPTIGITQTKSAIGYVTIRDGGIKQSIGWLGYGLTNITEFYVVLHSVNKTTGVMTRLYSTANIVGSVGTGSVPVWNYVTLPALNQINATPGDLYAIEYIVRGTGTYNIVGKTMSAQLPYHPTAIPAYPAASRDIDLAPSFQTVSPAVNASGSGSATAATTIAITAGDYLIVAATSYCFTTTSINVYCNGVAMTNLGSVLQYNSGGTIGYTTLYGMANPPSGGAVPISGVAIATSANIGIQGATYRNVSTVGAAVTASGGGTSMSGGSPAVPATQRVVHAFGAIGASSGYSPGTLRGTPGYITLGDRLGTGSTNNNTATLAAASPNNWGSVAVPLNGVVDVLPVTIANPSTFVSSPMAWSALVPWCGLSGIQGATQYSPVLATYGAGAGQSITNPTITYPWANYFDVIYCSDGSGGQGGAGILGGNCGSAGVWGSATLTKAQMGSSNLTLNVGPGGTAGSPLGNPGGAASGTTIVIPGYGTLAAAGASGGNGGSPSAYGVAPAPGPGNITVTDARGVATLYYGGAGGGGPQASGAQPGGAGAGGNSPGTVGTYTNGGAGGPGIVYIRAYQ